MRTDTFSFPMQRVEVMSQSDIASWSDEQMDDCPYLHFKRTPVPFPEAMGEERFARAMKLEKSNASSEQWEERMLYKELLKAYKKARRNGRNSYAQVRFEMNLSYNLWLLVKELRSRTYKPSRCIVFIVFSSVKREVIAPAFRDQVVDHLEYGYLSPIFERQFIYDSYSCREGKGTDFGIARLEHHIRSVSQNYTVECVALQLDFRGYFMSMNHDILYDRIADTLLRKGHRMDAPFPLCMFLVRMIIYTDPTVGCIVRGRGKDWKGLPRSKSYAYCKKGCGQPIGKLTSQLFSNIMNDILLQWLKREKKVRHLSGYVDDMTLVGRRSDLILLVPLIRAFAQERMGLQVHPRKVRLLRVKHGVPFLGTKITPKGRYVTRRAERVMRGKVETALSTEQNPFALQARVHSCRGYLLTRKSRTLEGHLKGISV